MEIIKCVSFHGWTLIIRKIMEKKKLFLPKHCNIMHPNKGNIIIVPKTKTIEIIMSIQVCLFHGCTLIIWKMVEKKLFLQIQSINITYPNVQKMIVAPKTKRMEIIMTIQVCLPSRMSFNHKKIGEKKKLFFPTKALISCIPMRKTSL